MGVTPMFTKFRIDYEWTVVDFLSLKTLVISEMKPSMIHPPSISSSQESLTGYLELDSARKEGG